MYHRKSDNLPMASRPENWTSLQNSGEIAAGVLVIQGDKHLVVAPTESVKDMIWSSVATTVGHATANRVVVLNDWDGKSKTAAILANATIGADGDGYAPGFCAAYSRVNANGKGLTAGKWWLPSIGELFMIFSNYHKINYCLSLISGATQLNTSKSYCSSTEGSEVGAWSLDLRYGILDTYAKSNVSHARRVRCVSEFI